MELAPLPPQMWYGPEITSKKQGRKKYKRKAGEHYAAASRLPDLASNRHGGILSLTTAEYHSDVIGLAAFRTTVDDSNEQGLEWNQDLYPNGPPAEHVLVAHGSQEATGHESVTFWSVSTLIEDEPSSKGGIGFSLHATLTEALDLGKVGPDVSVFASPTILRHWRRPRQVELRMESPSSSEQSLKRVTTVSVSAPIVRIHFLVVADDSERMPTIRAAVQDWNGGVTILDCSMLEKAASQTLSEEEYKAVYQENSTTEETVPLVKIVQDRSRSVQQLLSSTDQDHAAFAKLPVHSLQWFQKKSTQPASMDNVALAALTGDPCSLRLVFSSTFGGSEILQGAEGTPLYDTTVVPCLKNSAGTLHRFESGTKNLYLAFQSQHRQKQVLSFCGLQELGPGDIVKSLVRSSKLREAIAASDSLTTTERDSISDTIEQCKKRLWESELDFSALEAVNDDAYIVQQALFSTASQDVSQRIPAMQNGDMDLFRSVCRLALNRIQEARLGASLAIAGSVEEVKAVSNEITTRLVKLGTFELLCEHLSCQPSLDRFIRDYLPVTALDLARSFAKTCDIISLSLLFFRHRRDLHFHECDVLDLIPLSVSPSLYQHLLPVQNTSSSDLHQHQYEDFFLAGTDSDHLLEFSDMPEYLSVRFGVSAAIDEDDKNSVVENSLKPPGEAVNGASTERSVIALEEWYANRAVRIDQFISSLEHAAHFSKCALSALRLEYSPETFGASCASPAVEKLYRIAHFADTVRTVLPDPNDTKLLASLTSLGPDDFANMAAKELVSIVMNCKGESVDLKARYDQYLLPLMKEKFSGSNDNSIVLFEIDNGVESFCVSLFEADQLLNPGVLLDAVKLCSKIAWSSRTSLEQSSRIVKDKRVLIKLVLAIFAEVGYAASAMALPSPDQSQLVDTLWKIYETVPLTLPQNGDHEDPSSTKDLDSLFDSLVFLDLVVRWPKTDAFVLLQEWISLSSEEEERTSPRLIRFGEKTASMLCRSFCEQLKNVNDQSKDVDGAPELLSALLGDLDEMNRMCFLGCLSLKEVLTKCLFRPLLLQREITVLGEFLARADREVIDTESIAKEVSIFFNDAVYGSTRHTDGSGNMRLSAAMECQDVLGKWLPELRREFQAVRQYLDAAHHMSAILLPGRVDNLGPETIRTMLPLDVIEHVLASNPRSLICDCEDWADPAWAKEANETIRTHILGTSRKMPDEAAVSALTNLPPLPGQAVFHLAKLLGLESSSSAIAVKSRVIEYAVVAKLYGAAAAVCRSLIADASASDTDGLPVLDAVAKIVAHQEYDDVATKREICSVVLVQHSGNLSPSKYIPLEVILNVWNKIEHHDRIMERPPDCAIVSFGHFFHDTRKEYSTDLSDLFTTLHCQLADCVIDDVLLKALARYAAFWCIGRSTRPKTNPIEPFETSSTGSIVALSASLLLHIQNNDIARPCLDELRLIFDEQKTGVASLTSTGASWCTPDPSIVKGLMGRGYSEFGARRAAIMTNNAGFDAALQWAVLHSLDDGFDEPLTCFRSPTELFADRESKESLEACLALLEKIQSGSMNLKSLIGSWDAGEFHAIPVGFRNEHGATQLTPQEPVLVAKLQDTSGARPLEQHPIPASPNLSTVAKSASETTTVKSQPLEVPVSFGENPGPAAFPPGKPPADSRVTNGTPKPPASDSIKIPGQAAIPIAPKKGKLIVPGVKTLKVPGKGTLKVPSKIGQSLAPPPPPPKVVVPFPAVTTETLQTSPSPSTAVASATTTATRGVPRNVVPPPRQRLEPPVSSSDRSTLLGIGQAAFLSSRSSSPSKLEERKRLMEQGRLLLQKARSGSASPEKRNALRSRGPAAEPPPPPTPAPSAPPRPEPITATAEPPSNDNDDADEWDFDEDEFDL